MDICTCSCGRECWGTAITVIDEGHRGEHCSPHIGHEVCPCEVAAPWAVRRNHLPPRQRHVVRQDVPHRSQYALPLLTRAVHRAWCVNRNGIAQYGAKMAFMEAQAYYLELLVDARALQSVVLRVLSLGQPLAASTWTGPCLRGVFSVPAVRRYVACVS